MKPYSNKIFVQLDKTQDDLLPSGLYVINNHWKFTGEIVAISDESEYKVGDKIRISDYSRDKCIDEEKNLFVVYEDDIIECNERPTKDFVIAKLDYDKWKYKSVSGTLIERRTEYNYIVNGNDFGKHKSECVCTFATIVNTSKKAEENGFKIGEAIVYNYGYGLKPFKYKAMDICVQVPYTDILCRYTNDRMEMCGEWNFAEPVRKKASDLSVEETTLKNQYTLFYVNDSVNKSTMPHINFSKNGFENSYNAIKKETKVIAKELFKVETPDDKVYSLIRNQDIMAIIT